MSLLAACGGGGNSGDTGDTEESAADTEIAPLSLAAAESLEAQALGLPDYVEDGDPVAAGTPSDTGKARIQATPTPTTTTPRLLSTFASWVLELPVSASGSLSSNGPPHSLAVATLISGNPAPPDFLPRYFTTQSASLRFTAPPYGVLTSSAAGGARCELKQVSPARWNPMKGTHTMALTQTLTQTPRGRQPRVIVGQVHDSENLVLIKYYGPTSATGTKADTGKLQVEFNHGDPTGVEILDAAFKPETPFKVTIKIVDGQATVTYVKSNFQKKASRMLKPTGGDAYFKVGVYPQKHKAGDPMLAGAAELLLTTASITTN